MKHTLLVVDLDGTLLKSDMLHESFWSAVRRHWYAPILCLGAWRKGRAALKQYLANMADIDVTTLPYDTDVIAYIRAYRKKGGRTALVTASYETLARRIAKHLGIFDDVHGSDGKRNLKGKAKADFLMRKFGKNQFVYMGDTHADVASWAYAKKAITVNASQTVRKKVDALGKPSEHLATAKRSLVSYLKALRLHQWSKNCLIFLPMLTAHQFDMQTFQQSLRAFIAFSLVASGVYVLNDLLDLQADRAHPRKRFRPFAAGAIPISHGSGMIGALIISGAYLAASLGWGFFFIVLVYYSLATAYSLNLKQRILIDICVLASLYTIRIIAGSIVTGIALSVWLLAFSIFFFFALAAIKRQAELVDISKHNRLKTSGRGYYASDLPVINMIALGAGYASVLVMALYVSTPSVLELYTQPYALWGICCVLLYWITRIVIVTHRGLMHDDPVVFVLKDGVSQICFLLALSCAIAGTVL